MVALSLLAALALQQQALAGPTPTPAALAADTGSLRHANGRVPPVAWATRVTGRAPRIDGHLDDPAWTSLQPITQFTQRRPLDGQPSTESTEVRIAFDNEAVYVGVRMFDSEPQRIAARLGRRDQDTQSDVFSVTIDSYHDHRTAFAFVVNPLGVKNDEIRGGDSDSGDDSWDPVWDVATTRDSLGWTAEFRIPLSQLRYPSTPTQVWGFNFSRWIYRKDETTRWAWYSRADQGYASFFGHVFGFDGLPQPRRLELLPYSAGVEERIAPESRSDPFNDGSRELARAGMDLKYGLTSGLTLDATFNPDFGQVEADPAEVNLSDYETYFSERRPFFVEGANRFSFSGTQFFYSRRIGRAPQGSAVLRGDNSFVDQPRNSTILGAAKISGRTGSRWSVGLLDAVTAAEYATVDSMAVRFHDEVEPLTNHAVIRATREYGGGSSGVGLIATAVNRRIDDGRLDFLRSSAYAGGADFYHRFRQNRYRLYGSLGYSAIHGDTLAIQRAQRSSARYYQRPDAGYVEYDPGLTSLNGWTARLGLAKERGDFRYSMSARAVSPGFEVNDLGYQTSADDIAASLSASRQWNRPGRVIRSANLYVNGNAAWNFGGVRQSTNVNLNGYVELLSYWSASGGVTLQAPALSDALTRGGPLAGVPGGVSAYASVSSDFREPWQLGVSGNYSGDAMGGWYSGGGAYFTWRPTPTVLLTMSPWYSSNLSRQQFLRWSADSTAAATFGTRYVFAEILQHSLDLTTRLDITISPALSLQLYVQPFVGTGEYRSFKELVAARTTDYITYGTTPSSRDSLLLDDDGNVVGHVLDPDGAAGPRPSVVIGNPDFSYRSLRGSAVLRWEYRPGSTLFLVWTQSCWASEGSAVFDAGRDLRHLCQSRTSRNVFAVKASYWLNM